MTEQAEDMIRRHADMVFRLAVARCGNRSDADDIFQDVFTRYLSRRPVFESEEHARAWFIRVTINCSKSLRHSAWRRHTQPLEELNAAAAPPERELFYALQALPVRDRTLLHLFYYEQLETEQIGALLHTKPATVRTQLVRARRKLKAILEEEDDEKRLSNAL